MGAGARGVWIVCMAKAKPQEGLVQVVSGGLKFGIIEETRISFSRPFYSPYGLEKIYSLVVYNGMLIWIWGTQFPSAKMEAWMQEGHQVVHCAYQEIESDIDYLQSVIISKEIQAPDLVLVTDWEDSPCQSQRCEALRSLGASKVLFHAVAQPFPSDTNPGWAAWNAWPDGLELDCWEIAIPASIDSEAIRNEWRTLAVELQRELVFCPNRAGMVTPRVLACIINEAYLTRDQDIATAEDIDLGMRFGTNYPRGPFEWCRRIGAHRVVYALDAWAAEQPEQDAYRVAEGLRREASLHK